MPEACSVCLECWSPCWPQPWGRVAAEFPQGMCPCLPWELLLPLLLALGAPPAPKSVIPGCCQGGRLQNQQPELEMILPVAPDQDPWQSCIPELCRLWMGPGTPLQCSGEWGRSLCPSCHTQSSWIPDRTTPGSPGSPLQLRE